VWRSRTLLYVQGALGVPVVLIGLLLTVAEVLDLLWVAALATFPALAIVASPRPTGTSDWVFWLLFFWIPTGTAPPVIALVLAICILRGVSGAEAKAWFQG
jgi:hypothetical protein